MNLFDRLKATFSGAGRGDAALLYAVKCGRCGEIVPVRVDPRYDLDQEYDDRADAIGGYVLRKEVLGNRCPRLMRLEVRFDRGRRELSRSVEGGEFATLPER